MREFKYLVAPAKPKPGAIQRNAENTVLLAMTQSEAAKKYIFWSQMNFHYYVFDTIEEFELHAANTPQKDRCFYEVIFGDSPQRLKFDIDHATNEQFTKIMNLIKRVWKSDVSVLGPYENRSKSKLFIFQTDPESYHIVINYRVANVEIAKKFFDAVIAADVDGVAMLLDPRVYNKIQNFRIVGSQKRDKDFTKKQVVGSSTLLETLITWRGDP